MPDQALSDVKVLDLTWYITGPYCTKMLADYGADVIKIERPGGGDPARSLGPFLGDDPDPEKSAVFFFLNGNKKGITLNLKTALGKRIFLDLVKDADILVESFKPGTVAKFGLDYETLTKVNPKLVLASISNFGQTGPYRDFRATDLILTAMGNEMYSHGLPDLPPVKNPLTRDLIGMGSSAAAGVMAAYYGARWKGAPQYLDMAIFEMQMCGIDTRMGCLLAYQYSGRINERMTLGGGVLWGAYRCKDGYVDVTGGVLAVPRVIEMIGDERLRAPEFCEKDIFLRKPERLEEFNAIWYSWLERHSKKELDALFQRYKLQSSPFQTAADVASDPHFSSRDCFAEVEHPVMGRVRTLGRPFIMERMPWQLRMPAPLLGQHNEEVYGRLGYGKQDLVMLRQLGVI